jgi:hypothetical protein
MADVAAFVSTAYVIDHGFRPLVLDFQRGNEGILSRDCHAVSLTVYIDADREFEPHARISLTTRVRPGPQRSANDARAICGYFCRGRARAVSLTIDDPVRNHSAGWFTLYDHGTRTARVTDRHDIDVPPLRSGRRHHGLPDFLLCDAHKGGRDLNLI